MTCTGSAEENDDLKKTLEEGEAAEPEPGAREFLPASSAMTEAKGAVLHPGSPSALAAAASVATERA